MAGIVHSSVSIQSQTVDDARFGHVSESIRVGKIRRGPINNVANGMEHFYVISL